MTDLIQSTPAQAAVICSQLPGREIGLARREMENAAGGFVLPFGPSIVILAVAKLVAEAIVDYFDDGN